MADKSSAELILAAIHATNMPPGTFSLVQGGKRDVGEALVQHPYIKAVGFTGSLAGGRALFNLCAARPEPIPFFGELGSVNPMFLLPAALAARGEAMTLSTTALRERAMQLKADTGLDLVPTFKRLEKSASFLDDKVTL